MMILRNKLLTEVERLESEADIQDNKTEFRLGYKQACQSIADDIDVQMLGLEKDVIISAFDDMGLFFSGEVYYNQYYGTPKQKGE